MNITDTYKEIQIDHISLKGNLRLTDNLLTEQLTDYRNNKDAVLVTIPRGSVPVGYVPLPKFLSNIIEEETERIRDLLKQRHKLYYGTKTPLQLKDKIVIIVDDGIATGNTLLSSIQLIEQEEPSQIIVALPVAPSSALKKIKDLRSVTDAICLNVPGCFHAVGHFMKIIIK